MTEFYSSIESKSVYEAEDIVLELLGDADHVLQWLGQAARPDLSVETLAHGGQALVMRFQASPMGAQQVAAVVALEAGAFIDDAQGLLAWAQEVVKVPVAYAQRQPDAAAAPPTPTLHHPACHRRRPAAPPVAAGGGPSDS
jgi:hypothetical protein